MQQPARTGEVLIQDPTHLEQAGPEPVRAGSGAPLARDIWSRLGETKNACPDEFDYFPDGGMRIFACHLKSLTSYDVLHQTSGLQIFAKGPHSNSHLVLDSPNSFGYYNPAFVQWMVNDFVPGGEDQAFRAATQAVYDQKVAPLARVSLYTYRKLLSDRPCFAREKEKLQRKLNEGELPGGYYEKYFYFMNKLFCSNPEGGFGYFTKRGFDGGYPGNVVKTCVGFWLRRAIDGTDGEFYRGLEKLVATYEPRAL